MNKISVSLLALVMSVVSSCATAGKMNRISLGMSKGQVIDELGDPDTTSALNGMEALVYNKYANSTDAFYGNNTQYLVIIEGGKVTRYGSRADMSVPHEKRIVIENKTPTSATVVAE